MDGRWVLLTLAVAVVAAIRLRRRNVDGSSSESSGAEHLTAAEDPSQATSSEPEPRHAPHHDSDPSPDPSPDPSRTHQQGHYPDHRHIDRQDDQHEDYPDRHRHDVDPRSSAAQDEAAFDIESVGAALERVWAEHAHDADTILDARLRQLIDRRVPVRGLRRAPGERAVRVAFADGTVLLCRGSGQGDFGRLGLALHRRSVRLAAFAHVEDHTRLEFAWNPDHRLAAVAVGLDQPD